MDETEWFASIAIALALLPTILVLILASLFKISMSISVGLFFVMVTFITSLIFFLIALTTTKVTWVKRVCKGFFILPLGFTTVFLISQLVRNFRWLNGFEKFYSLTYILAIILVFCGISFYIIRMDNSKNNLMKIITYIGGILIYILSFFFVLSTFVFMNQQLYGTPLHRPKIK